ALEEGNTFQLADYCILKGSAYSCLFLEDMMLLYYRRAVNLLQNTGWRDRLDALYYNIGATMLNLGRYDEAQRHLDLAAGMAEDPLMLHKRALLAIRRGDVARGRELIEAMRLRLSEAGNARESDWLRAEEAEWECRPDFLGDREYLALLDRLLKALARDYHFGHVSFYQDVYLAACKRRRQYRKALAFQREISERSVKIIG
ncbi:MAG: XRE family transcriptional regulator, partial [Clostridia bacterium]|nr:XRE family transcriptional regulator [Clostridia bacterium]